jgi:quercetin dioxygenase-like cupin family protein
VDALGTGGEAPSTVMVVHLDDVDPIALPGGSWSRMLITDETAYGTTSSLGYSVFKPGSETVMVAHQTEEVAYVVTGSGELRLDRSAAPFKAGDALHIPADLWHRVANTGSADLVMVFGFPYPDYPPTERR